jgi:hypothetical protein
LQALAFSIRATRGAATARRPGPTRAGFRATSLGHFEVRIRPFSRIRSFFRSVRLIET